MRFWDVLRFATPQKFWQRRSGGFRCGNPGKRRLRCNRLRDYLQTRALGDFVGLITARYLTEPAYEGETFIGILLGHSINVELKPIFGLFSNKFGHSL